jgi:hypothetical protein
MILSDHIDWLRCTNRLMVSAPISQTESHQRQENAEQKTNRMRGLLMNGYPALRLPAKDRPRLEINLCILCRILQGADAEPFQRNGLFVWLIARSPPCTVSGS